MVTEAFWKGKRVLITGHTGFKGSWLSLWLKMLGAEVIGYSLSAPTIPNLYELAGVEKGMISIKGDIRDLNHLRKVIETHRPEVVFHLAAQSLVRRSYQDPIETYFTNVMGTVYLLEAVRRAGNPGAVINVTSDKCYENKEWLWGYREDDPMGGFDPYSSSKGCSEIITAAFRNSFFHPQRFDHHGIALASVRAGNVIGGGDWAQDRLLPDIMKALLEKRSFRIRSPQAVRPWQHVLEPLSGYLILAEKLYTNGPEYAESWNFGPSDGDIKTVSWIVEYIGQRWGQGIRYELDNARHPHEANYLKLDYSKAKMRLGWTPRLSIEQALELTLDWYRAYQSDPSSVCKLTESQINHYHSLVVRTWETNNAVFVLSH
ncbi:MAG: CDP-glucose 4,6-dehydratase [bacterium]